MMYLAKTFRNFGSTMLFREFCTLFGILNFFYSSFTDESFVDATRVWCTTYFYSGIYDELLLHHFSEILVMTMTGIRLYVDQC